MTLDAPARPAIEAGPRIAVSRGLITVTVAVVALFVASALLAPTSISRGALIGMLPFASVLAIAAIGQTLVVQQGGIDLSVPGAISLAVVIATHQPNGDDSKLLPALALGLAVAVVAGIGNGVLIGRLGLNPIVATLGMNALLYAGVLGISGGSPRRTTDLLRSAAGGLTWGIPNSVYVAVVVVAVAAVVVKMTVAGRRFEAVGANAAGKITDQDLAAVPHCSVVAATSWPRPSRRSFSASSTSSCSRSGSPSPSALSSRRRP